LTINNESDRYTLFINSSQRFYTFSLQQLKKGMKNFLFSRSALWSNSICLLRIWSGIIFIRYGLSILHSNSVEDFANTLKTVNIPLPLLSAYLCKSTEFFGGIFLVIGFLVRPACVFLFIDMTVATFVFHHGELLNNGLTTFLLLICVANIFFNKPDFLCISNFITRKTKVR
jgi:putative oxidoreductase